MSLISPPRDAERCMSCVRLSSQSIYSLELGNGCDAQFHVTITIGELRAMVGN